MTKGGGTAVAKIHNGDASFSETPDSLTDGALSSEHTSARAPLVACVLPSAVKACATSLRLTKYNIHILVCVAAAEARQLLNRMPGALADMPVSECVNTAGPPPLLSCCVCAYTRVVAVIAAEPFVC